MMLESELILQFGSLKCFGMKGRHAIFVNLMYNLFEIIQKNLSLVYDEILRKQKVKKIDIFKSIVSREVASHTSNVPTVLFGIPYSNKTV